MTIEIVEVKKYGKYVSCDIVSNGFVNNDIAPYKSIFFSVGRWINKFHHISFDLMVRFIDPMMKIKSCIITP